MTEQWHDKKPYGCTNRSMWSKHYRGAVKFLGDPREGVFIEAMKDRIIEGDKP